LSNLYKEGEKLLKKEKDNIELISKLEDELDDIKTETEKVSDFF